MMIQNKVVVITGGCGQIGYAAAKRFATDGTTVVALVRKNLEDAELMLRKLPNQNLNHKAILASVIDTDSIKSAVQQVNDAFGRCDILINAAGVNKVVTVNQIEDFSDEIFDSIVDTNLKGTFVCVREFLPLLKKDKGLIINISSLSAYSGKNINLAYAASKAGVNSLTKSLAVGLAPDVRVVGIAPGYLEKATSGINKHPDFNAKIAHEIPLKRVATGDDIADVIMSLVDGMSYITGETIKVDGGRSA
jgi:3-oxoacyl-[acyl-carrier protein] reductase